MGQPTLKPTKTSKQEHKQTKPHTTQLAFLGVNTVPNTTKMSCSSLSQPGKGTTDQPPKQTKKAHHSVLVCSSCLLLPPSCLLVVCISIAEAEQYQAMGNRSSVDITGEDYKKQKRSEREREREKERAKKTKRKTRRRGGKTSISAQLTTRFS